MPTGSVVPVGAWLGPLIGALGALIAVWLSNRSAKRARVTAERVAALKVDAEAYVRAQRTYDDLIKNLQTELRRISEAHEAEIARCKTRITDLQHEVDAMRALTRQHIIDVASRDPGPRIDIPEAE